MITATTAPRINLVQYYIVRYGIILWYFSNCMFKNSKANDIFIKEMMEIIIYTCDVKHSFHVSNIGADP